ncbi:MAG: radical SAM protein, partial [Candidatus Omnitrophota bacterium]
KLIGKRRTKDEGRGTKGEKKNRPSEGSERSSIIHRSIIGLIGCMAKNKGEEIFKKWPHVDLIVAPARLHKIPEYIEKLQAPGCRLQASQSLSSSAHELISLRAKLPRPLTLERLRIIDVEDGDRKEEFYRAEYREKKSHAQVVISTGCSNYCSYCVVPYVRGELRLRSPRDIIAEVKRNVALGRTKITLLGQNVNDYNYRLQARGSRLQDEERNTVRSAAEPPPGGQYAIRDTTINFVDLLRMVEEIEGVEEIEFLTPHPKNTSKELFRLMAKSKKIRKYLHLPYQSGSDRILKLMHRGYTKKDYLSLVEDYKTIVGGTIGTDIIVGFPGETDEDFAHTKDVLEKVRFMGAYIFKYSPRPNTRAMKLADDVPPAVKEKRHRILLDLQRKISSGK